MISENVRNAARRARIARIAIASVGLNQQPAIGPLDCCSRRGKGDGSSRTDAGNRRAVGTLRIRASRTTGRTLAGDDIACLRRIGIGCHILTICAGDWCIVEYGQRQRPRCDITITISDRNGNNIARGRIGRIVGQRIAVPNRARRDTGDRDQPQRRGDRLAHRSHNSAVDGYARGLVKRNDLDRARYGFCC